MYQNTPKELQPEIQKKKRSKTDEEAIPYIIAIQSYTNPKETN